MIDDALYALKAHSNQLQKELEKINYEIEVIYPKHKDQAHNLIDKISSIIISNEKSTYEINLENRRNEIIQELETIRKRIKLLEKGR
jgi:hypothetical protein